MATNRQRYYTYSRQQTPPLELHRAQQVALERVAPPHVIGANPQQIEESRVFQWTDNRVQLGLDLAAMNDGTERRKKLITLMRDQGVGINKVINAFILQQSQKLRQLRNKMSTLASQSVDHLGSALIEFLRLVEASDIPDIYIPAGDIGISEDDVYAYVQRLLDTLDASPSSFSFTLSSASNADDISNASYRTIRDTNTYILQNLNRITANVMSAEFEHMDTVRRGLSQATHRRFLRQQKIDLKRRVSRVFNWIGMKVDTATHHVSVRSGIPLFLLQTLLLVIGTLTLHIAAQASLPYLQTTGAGVGLSSDIARWWSSTMGISLSNTLILFGVSAVLWQFGAFFQRAVTKAADVLERYNIPYWVKYISSLVFAPVRAVYNVIWRTEEAGSKLLAQTVSHFQTPDKVLGKTSPTATLANAGVPYDPIDDIIRSYFFTRVCAELMVFYNNLLGQLQSPPRDGNRAAFYRTALNYYLLLSSLHRALKDVTSVIEFWQHQRYERSIAHLQRLGNSLETVLATSIAFKNARAGLTTPAHNDFIDSSAYFDTYSDQLYGFLKAQYAHLRSLVSAAERDRTLVERMRLERARGGGGGGVGGVYSPGGPIGGSPIGGGGITMVTPPPVTGANTAYRGATPSPRTRVTPPVPATTTAAVQQPPVIILNSPVPQAAAPFIAVNGNAYYDTLMNQQADVPLPLRTPYRIKQEAKATPQTSYTTPFSKRSSASVRPPTYNLTTDAEPSLSSPPVYTVPSSLSNVVAAVEEIPPSLEQAEMTGAAEEGVKPIIEPPRARLSRAAKTLGAARTRAFFQSQRR